MRGCCGRLSMATSDRPILSTGNGLARRLEARLRPIRAAPTVAAGLLYLVSAALVTWPLVLHLGSSIYLAPGRPLGDYTGVIAYLRESAGSNPFLPGRLVNFNAPDGHAIPWALNVLTFPRTAALYGLTAVVGATAAFGLFVLLGYVASGTALFAFLRWRQVAWPIAAIFGWAMAFFPFALSSGEAPDYLHSWVFVLMAWRLLCLHEDPTMRNGLWAGTATLVCIAWTPYFVLIGGVFYATAVALDLGSAAFRGDLVHRVLPHAVGALPVALFLALARLLALADSEVTGERPNTLVDVIANSARPKYYLVPPDWSAIWRVWSHHYWSSRGMSIGHDRALYVGYSVVILATVAGVLVRRLARPDQRLAVGAMVAGAVAVLFSAPPQVKVAGQLIALPSYYVFHVSQDWRIYSRFAIVVMLALCVLAALGASYLVSRSRGMWKLWITLAVGVVVPLDLLGLFADRVRTDLSPPGIYTILRAQPPGLVAEYPIRPTEVAGDYRELFWQSAHGKPVINGWPARSYEESRALALADLDAPLTAPTLAALGVRYVLLQKHPTLLAPGILAPRPPTSAAYEPIAADRYAFLFRVRAEAAPLVVPVEGFGMRTAYANPARPMTTDTATMRVTAPCGLCVGVLRFTAESPQMDRVLKVSTTDDKVLYRTIVRRGIPQQIIVPLHWDYERCGLGTNTEGEGILSAAMGS